MRLAALLLCLVLPLGDAAAPSAQETGVLRLDDQLSEFLTRQQTRGLLPGAPMDVQPITADIAQELLDSVAVYRERLPSTDRQLLARYRGQAPGPNVEWVRSWVPALYDNGQSFFSVIKEDYALEVSPTLYLAGGSARQTASQDREPTEFAYQASRGVRAGGRLGDHVFFETQIEENQRRAVPFVTTEVGQGRGGPTAPRLGDVKFPGDVYDYWRASGSVGYQDRYLTIRFGRDRNQWGPGQNSLILTDYPTDYDQLLVRARFWRLDYTSIAARFTIPDREDGATFGQRFGAFHRLGLSLPGNIDLELFETVVGGTDSTSRRQVAFEPSYLNPVIFWRAVEADLGSPDNVLLGSGLAWRPVSGLRLYGQLILDELKFSEIGSDWWANKYGWMLGAHMVDPGISNLELRAEVARLRPFIYSHRSLATHFAHYGDGLGHVAGPNSQDVSVFARYRPLPQISAALNVAYTQHGRNGDIDGDGEVENVGGSVLESYNTRENNYGYNTLDGIREDSWLVEGRLGWELLPDLWLEGALVFQSEDDAVDGLYRVLTGSAQLRWGIPFRSERY